MTITMEADLDRANRAHRRNNDVGGKLITAAKGMASVCIAVARPVVAYVRANPTTALVRTAVGVVVIATVQNAAFGQGTNHEAPWFGSSAEKPATTEVQPAAPKRARIADPVVFGIQSELTDRGFYGGEIDGLVGARTREAIKAYEKSVGITPRGEPTSALLDRIRLGKVASLPRAEVRPADEEPTGSVSASPPAESPVLLVQRALVAYGEQITVDGVMGPNTRAAIEAFEGAHGMTVTGEASDELIARMKSEGLL